jgi:hypothetical protein
MSALSMLTIAASTERPLTPEQRKFNQLVRKVEQARAELLAWQEQGAGELLGRLFCRVWHCPRADEGHPHRWEVPVKD